MSEYLEKLKKLSESQYFYAEAPWLKAIEHIEQLEKELCEAMDFADEKIKFCMHLTEQNNKLQDENATLKQMHEHLKWKDEVRKENAELREAIAEVIGTYIKPYDLCGGWGEIKSNYVAMENAILKLKIAKEQGE